MAQGACAGLERQEESLLVGMYSEPILGVLTKLNSPMSPALLRFASAQSLCVHRTSSALCQPTVARAPALRSCTRPCCCLKPPQQTISGAMRPTIFPKALAGQLLSQRPTACRSACWLLCCAEVLQYLQRDRCALSGRRHRLAPHRLPAAPRLGCRCVAACPPMPVARPACMALSETPEWALSSSHCGRAAASLVWCSSMLAQCRRLGAATSPLARPCRLLGPPAWP